MNLIVTAECRFDRTPDGVVWTREGYTHSFWKRYLAVFDRVRVMARVRQVPSVPPDWKRADGARVSFAAVPYYIGPWQYLRRSRQVQRTVRSAVGANDAVIMRVGSQIADCLVRLLRRTDHPYGLEVVGDPYDTFAPGAMKHPLRPFFRWLFTHQLRGQCAGACAAAYVTEHTLQRRYPPAPGVFSTHYSSVDLPDAAFVSVPRPPAKGMRTFNLIMVGTLAQLYKAPDVLIDAVSTGVREGLDLQLVLVGDGKHRSELEARAVARGLKDRACFQGRLPAGEAVRAQLDQADLFVLPSRQEGLPRAMIEAMARALPCIGSTAGGIPELLPSEDMVPPGDVAALARRIREVVSDPERMARMSTRNLEKAGKYSDKVLRERRIAFYRCVRKRAEAWLKSQG
jgi:glycosyltransferase involved in cell wall biosynthesis